MTGPSLNLPAGRQEIVLDLELPYRFQQPLLLFLGLGLGVLRLLGEDLPPILQKL